MDEMAEAIRTKYNENIDNDSDTDYGIVISSGYRNPRHNDTVGGLENSKRQWGRAVDLVPEKLPPNVTKEEALKRIELTAGEAGYDRVIRYGDHIHVQS